MPDLSINASLQAKFSCNTWEHYTPTYISGINHQLIGNDFIDLASDQVANFLMNAKKYFSMGFPGRPVDMKHAFLNPYGGKTNGKSNAMLQWDELLRLWKVNEIESAVFLAFNFNQVALGGDHGMTYFPRIDLSKRVQFLRCELDIENWKPLFKARFEKAVKDKGYTEDITRFIKEYHAGIKYKVGRAEQMVTIPDWNRDLMVYLRKEADRTTEMAVYHTEECLWFFPQGGPPHHSSIVFLPRKDRWSEDMRHFTHVARNNDLQNNINVNFWNLPNFNLSVAANMLGN